MLSGAFLLTVAIALQPPAARPTPAAAADDRPFARLIQNLGHDLRALPSADTAIAIGVGGAGAIGVRSADGRLAAWAEQRGDSAYADLGDVLGNAWVESGAAVGVYVAGRVSHHPRAAHVGSDLVRGQILNGILTVGIKTAVRRERPNGGTESFPSGHTSAAFTSATILQGNFGWKVGGPAYALAGFVGWTRVRDDQHWLTDVIIGGAVGAIAGLAVTGGHEHRRWQVTPTATRQSFGVLVTRTAF